MTASIVQKLAELETLAILDEAIAVLDSSLDDLDSGAAYGAHALLERCRASTSTACENGHEASLAKASLDMSMTLGVLELLLRSTDKLIVAATMRLLECCKDGLDNVCSSAAKENAVQHG